MSISTIITSIILSIFTFFSSLMAPSFAAPVPQIEQDDFIPVLRFVATSDTHIEKLGDHLTALAAPRALPLRGQNGRRLLQRHHLHPPGFGDE
ncbi:MAG: hypothetical protein IJ962_01355, partial [Clostridia bacterium]|nr:hypothetical protein [Clostridia bacterium]